MTIARILAEYRSNNMVVLLERVESGEAHVYRTSVYHTYPSISKAEKHFLKNISQGRLKQAFFANEIKKNNKEFVSDEH